MEDDNRNHTQRPDRAVPTRPETGPTRSIDSAQLLAGAREIVIRHGDSRYRLRSTNKGKLILTK